MRRQYKRKFVPSTRFTGDIEKDWPLIERSEPKVSSAMAGRVCPVDDPDILKDLLIRGAEMARSFKAEFGKGREIYSIPQVDVPDVNGVYYTVTDSFWLSQMFSRLLVHYDEVMEDDTAGLMLMLTELGSF
jgi:hypothetical protein